ncbi:MFS transporter [Francisella sp. LA112445]|uniref:MFS transporter n=1 Tax=Francisella sp. LA112445 TaxID=1395624 RepID=UPI001788B7B4|nr:MFS transporter [Francisella sp. LA112445]QIW10498.1 MHS family MFS transporter [Francisella sp. LA112445]
MVERVFRVLKNSFGNIIEWYDFSLYGYFATIIAVEFFPKINHWVALISAFGAFAAGFVARPIGSVVFGRLGDKLGRHYAMNIAIIFMAIPTIIMAFLPGYNTIGFYAPILLVLVRVFQGLSAGGQFGNLMTLTAEQENQPYRGFNLAVAYATSIVGFLLASGVSYLTLNFLPESWQNYAWRFPFALGFFLLLIHFFIKEDKKVENSENNFKVEPIRDLLKHYPWRLTLVVCLSTTAMVLYYLDITYMVTYMETELNLSLTTALAINTISIAIMCVVTPLAGYLSDIFGRKRTHIIGYVILLVLCVPMVMFMQLQNIALITSMVIAMAALTAIIQGVSTPYYTETFPPRVRATGCSIGFGFGASLSGFAPMIATIVMGWLSPTIGLCLFLLAVAVIGLIIAIIIPNQQVEVRRLNSIEAFAS